MEVCELAAPVGYPLQVYLRIVREGDESDTMIASRIGRSQLFISQFIGLRQRERQTLASLVLQPVDLFFSWRCGCPSYGITVQLFIHDARFRPRTPGSAPPLPITTLSLASVALR